MGRFGVFGASPWRGWGVVGLLIALPLTLALTKALAQTPSQAPSQAPSNAPSTGKGLTEAQMADLAAAYGHIAQSNDTGSIGPEVLRELCQIGPRLTGTDRARRAEDYILHRMRRLKLGPNRYEPFAMRRWQRAHLELEAVPAHSDHFVRYEATALAHSPLDVDIEAELIDLGNGMPEDYARLPEGAVTGRVVLANLASPPGRRSLHRSEKTTLAIEAGAAGIILINSAPGRILLTGTASRDGLLIPIPAVCLSQDAGKALRRWNQEEGPLRMTIRMENTFEPAQARNVTTTMPGRGRPGEVIMAGAHLDSWDLSPGALDNALGAAVLAEAARLLGVLGTQGMPLGRTVQFNWYMGEEQGLLGSRHQVAELRRRGRLNRVRYMLNVDMAGNAKGWSTFGLGQAAGWFEQVGTAIADTGYANDQESKADLHSDHQPFLMAGIPVAQPLARLPQALYHCYHADCDRPSLIEPHYINRTARVLALYLYALSTAPQLPAQPLTPEQTKAMLIRAGLKEKLQLANDWPYGD